MGEETATAEGASNGGEAAKAAEFNKLLKARIAGLQDKLLITKYRSEYENILLNLDVYMKLNMLQTALQIKPNQESEPGKPNPNMVIFGALKAMSDARGTLNGIMTYLDSQ